MIVKSKILELNKWLFVEEVIDEYIKENPLIENRSKINVGSIEMENFQLSTSGLFILQSRMNFAKPVHFQTEIEGEAVTSQFIFYRPLNASRKQERSRHNIRYIPSFNSVQEVREGFEYTYFIAVLSKSYYLNLIKRNPYCIATLSRGLIGVAMFLTRRKISVLPLRCNRLSRN